MHWSQFVGGDVVISPPFEWQVRLNASGHRAGAAHRRAGGRRRSSTRCTTTFPDFRRAFDADGMTLGEFEDYGATRKTLRQFLAACAELEGARPRRPAPRPGEVARRLSRPGPDEGRAEPCRLTATTPFPRRRCRLILVRHGEVESHRGDHPLTEAGRDQAERAGRPAGARRAADGAAAVRCHPARPGDGGWRARAGRWRPTDSVRRHRSGRRGLRPRATADL